MSLGLRPYAILEAPSVLGLKPTGVDNLPGRMLALGLAQSIHARRAGRLEPPPYDPQRDEETGTLNAGAIGAWTPQLADAIESVLDQGEFPVILGGDCSILLGATLALRRRGRYGLLFIDGHADFYQPEANPNGEAASMDLALATGYGPRQLTDLEGLRPLVLAEDVVLFAHRDDDEQKQYGSQPVPAHMGVLDLALIRRTGIVPAVHAAMEHLTRPELDGFFIHVDADVLADEIMPAVDYRLPGGLTWDELATVIGTALSTGKAAGLELTIYNPSLDEDGSAGRGLADLLTRTLGTGAPTAPVTERIHPAHR